MKIDLNADVGEGAPNDEAILAAVSSANIACGGHAGDRASMLETCRLARELGVRVGAHPGYPDRAGFGRRELGLSPAEIEAAVLGQLHALATVGSASYVKLHGALYHRAGRDPAAAAAVLDAIDLSDVPHVVLCLAGSELDVQAASRGYTTIAEGFADRRYAADGSLLPREVAGSLLEPGAAAAQAVSLAAAGRVSSICVHGDGPDAAATADTVAEALRAAGFTVAAA
jgi:UPF0271 protein